MAPFPILCVISFVIIANTFPITTCLSEPTSSPVIVSNSMFDYEFEATIDTLNGRVSEAMSSRQEGGGRRGVGEVEGGPRLEVAYLLRDAVEGHLPGCHKVVLYESDHTDSGTEFSDIAQTLSRMLGDALVLFEIETFLTEAPPVYYTFRMRHLRAKRQYCAAFVILASLEYVSRAFKELQTTSWFLGSEKYILSYTAENITKKMLESEPQLRTSYNFVLATQMDTTLLSSTHTGPANRRFYALLQNCPYCSDGDPRVNLANYWTPVEGFWMEKPLYPDMFRDFNGHKFSAVTLVYEPFSCYEKKEDELIPADNCVDNNMLREIAATLNFTYRFVEPKDGQWGHRLDNGSYTGVIGAVERMEADFSLNIAITQDREEKVDCTIGYHVEPITFATSKPRPLNQALALIRPFAPKMWAAFTLTLVLSGPTYFLISKFTVASKKITRPSLVTSYLIVFAACFNQGVKFIPVFSNRLFGMSYVITMFVTVTVYIAMLTATLTLPTLSPTLNTLEELVRSDFSWGIQDLGAADYQLLKSSTVPLYQEVFKGLKPCPSLDECIMQARDSKYAFITWRTYLEDRIAVRFTSATGEKQLHVATGDIFPVELGWAMNPGCPYRQAFNRKIRALLHSGLISKWLSDLIHDPQRRELDENEKIVIQPIIQALSLNHLQGVFFLLGFGFVLSCVSFFCEATVCKRKDERN